MKLEGADWTSRGIELNGGDARSVDTAYIVWRKAGGPADSAGTVNLPVYLNQDRSSELFSVDLEASGCSGPEVAQRGVCVTAL